MILSDLIEVCAGLMTLYALNNFCMWEMHECGLCTSTINISLRFISTILPVILLTKKWPQSDDFYNPLKCGRLWVQGFRICWDPFTWLNYSLSFVLLLLYFLATCRSIWFCLLWWLFYRVKSPVWIIFVGNRLVMELLGMEDLITSLTRRASLGILHCQGLIQIIILCIMRRENAPLAQIRKEWISGASTSMYYNRNHAFWISLSITCNLVIRFQLTISSCRSLATVVSEFWSLFSVLTTLFNSLKVKHSWWI